MFGIGGFELFIILVFGFLIFGPEKLPEIAKTVGKGIARFREAQQEMNDTLGGEKIFDPTNADEPFKDPVEVLDRIAQRQEDKKTGKAAASKPRSDKDASASTAAADRRAAEAAPSSGEAAKPDAALGQPAREETREGKESFTERKARYERERAARKAAEAEAAAQQPASPADPAHTEASAASGADAAGAPDAPVQSSRPEGGDA